MSIFWKKILLRLILGLGLIAAAMLSGFLSMRYASRREIATLPSLIGLNYADASSRALSLGFRVEIENVKTVTGVAPKTVLSQYPSEGTPLKSGQTIRVILSREKEPVSLPTVIGSSLRMAEMQLAQSGYRLGKVCRTHLGIENTSEIVRNTAAYPSGNDLSETVDILVNEGPEDLFYLMPDLLGRDVNSALRLFDRRGISIKNIRYVSGSEKRKGIIVGQQPSSGSRLGVTDPISLEVSS